MTGNQHDAPWSPQHLLRVVRSYSTSMGTTEVVTDLGGAYIKVLGNKEGPHPLATDWVCTQLASWFGLPTFEIALLNLDASDVFNLPGNRRAESGPAFASRAVKGHTWDSTEVELEKLINPEMITRLVVFDSWIRNCDRHPPDLTVRKPNFANVFLAEAEPAGKLRIMAMDHSHCLTCGREWSPRMADIDKIQDGRLYGVFPAFVPYLRRDVVQDSIALLRDVESGMVREVVASIPREWQVSPEAAAAAVELIYRRAAFVADNIELSLPLGPDQSGE